MTQFLQDILRQPEQLQRVVSHFCNGGRRSLQEAACRLRDAHHVYLTGIGASLHAALCAQSLFYLGGLPVYVQEASELWQFAKIPAGSVLVVISRSGRSLEITHLLSKARESGAFIVGITNFPDGPLAREAHIPIVVPVELDHGISVSTYSSLAAAAGLLASTIVGGFNDALADSLLRAIAAMPDKITAWQEQISSSAWPTPGAIYYFLARGGSLGTCHEARLLWEEGVKSPATAMGTSSFRHGPQEIISKGARFAIWFDGQRMREQDLAVARDMTSLGASIMLIGQHLPEDGGDLVLQLAEVPADWQFLIDVIPVQLAAERLARFSGVDPDRFRLCSYIVEDEYGLMPRNR